MKDDSLPHLLFIVGMQKSGTSLLNRMLMVQDFINNPFLPEGKHFWGDDPPFSPEKSPCGELYQKHQGKRGHYLDDSDFQIEHQELLVERIHQAQVKEPILLNKNPYNTVRLRWLKRIFPEAKIIATIRHPVANVYSLLKKYHQPFDDAVSWWGVKPDQWQLLLSQDKLVQSSLQWVAVNKQLLDNKHLIDYFVDYKQLCSSPNHHLQKILNLLGPYPLSTTFDTLKCFDEEYLRGSRSLSKNIEIRKNGRFDLTNLNERIEVPPFNSKSVSLIKQVCEPTWLGAVALTHYKN